MTQVKELVELMLASDEEKRAELAIVIAGILGDAVVRIADALETLAGCEGSVAGSSSGGVFHHKEYK
jgi:hypothetical protein